jgi:hypothetical protein
VAVSTKFLDGHVHTLDVLTRMQSYEPLLNYSYLVLSTDKRTQWFPLRCIFSELALQAYDVD